MSFCDRLRDLMLEADLSELEGLGETEVATHVRACDACRERARRILTGTALLGEALSEPSEIPDLDGILRRAGVAGPAGSAPLGPTRGRRPPWSGWTMTAAAAMAAGLLLFGERHPVPPDPLPSAQAAAMPLVEAAPGSNVAIIPTENPRVTVLWFY